MGPAQLREALRVLAAEVAQKNQVIARHEREAAFRQATIDKLTHENAVLKRLKFAAQSERFSAEQRSLLEEALNADLQAVAEEINAASAGSLCQATAPAAQAPAAASGPAAPRSTP